MVHFKPDAKEFILMSIVRRFLQVFVYTAEYIYCIFTGIFLQVLPLTLIQITLLHVLCKCIGEKKKATTGNLLQQAVANTLGLISKVMFVWGTFSTKHNWGWQLGYEKLEIEIYIYISLKACHLLDALIQVFCASQSSYSRQSIWSVT